jgi:hypothetical protein
MTEEELRKRLEMLRIEHRDLDAAIDALTGAGARRPVADRPAEKAQAQAQGPDRGGEDYLIPDIIA